MTHQLSRRAFLKAAALGTAGFALVACTKKDNPRPMATKAIGIEPLLQATSTQVVPNQAPPSAGEPVSLNFWGWTDPVWMEAVNQYPVQNAGVKVNVSELGDATFGGGKFLAAMAAGVGPDVAIQNRHTFLQFALRNLYQDVTSYMDPAGLKKTDFTPVQIEETSWDSKVFGLPLFTHVRYLYWNKKQYEEVGLDPVRPPTTWAELETYSGKLNVKDANGDLERIGFVPYLFGNSWMWLYGFLNKAPAISQDKRTILCDDPRWIEALEWMVKFYDDHVGSFEAANAFGDAITAAGLGDPFAAGKVSMLASGDWQVGDFLRIPNLNWGCAPMPIPPKGEKSTWSCGWSVVMTPQSAQSEAAFDFMKWLVSVPGWEAHAEAASKATSQAWEREKLAGDPMFWPTQACYLPALEMLAEKYVSRLGEREQQAWAMGMDALQNYTHGCGIEMGGAALDYWAEMDNATRSALEHAQSPKQAMRTCQQKVQEATDRFWNEIDSLK